MRGKHGRLRSFRRFCFQMLQCGGSNAKFERELQSDSGTENSENGIVVDGMSDAEHHFPSQVRPHRFRLGFAITHAVRHNALTLKNVARNVSEFVDQTFGYETCTRHRVLHLRVPTPLIVVDLASPNSFRQTEEVIEHVPVVGSQRRRELSFKRARVYFLADALQKDAALLQDISSRSIQ